ncbi:MAG: hypothetical protein A4E44_01865 [Methanosaeta sp. PtaB.Bin018]|nr:MAG: hypothetical protein A4E44_01865 [Methanosaeta sp. PtaB.Bin018]
MVNFGRIGISGYIKIFSICLLSFLLLAACSNARVGYSLNVFVNNESGSSSWSSSMSTEALAFRAQSELSGTGNSSKYVRVSDMAGMNFKDSGYTKQGRLIDNSTLSVASKARYIHIQETGTDNSTVYNAVINQSLPTVLYAANELYYRGDGMSTRNQFVNGKDKIVTSLSGTTLTKSAVFGGAYNDSMTFVEVTPVFVKQIELENRTTAFRITSASDKYTKLGFKSGEAIIEQEYVGAFKMDTKLIKGNTFHFRDDLGYSDKCGCGIKGYAWLPCCSDGYLGISRDFGSDLSRIFDYTSFGVNR